MRRSNGLRVGLGLTCALLSLGARAGFAAEDFVLSRITPYPPECQDPLARNGFSAISPDGTRIAFSSICDLTGDNADGGEELYMFDTTTRRITQLTSSPANGCTSNQPAMTADGKRIAFISTCNLTGENTSGNARLHLLDTDTETITQLTTGSACGDGHPSITPDGTRVAFESKCNLTGGDVHLNPGIYLYDVATTALAEVVSLGRCRSNNASISADGTRVAFESTCNLTTNPPIPVGKIYVFDTTTQMFTQITTNNMCGTSGTGSLVPAISADGKRVAFVSRCNLVHNPEFNYELFLYDLPSGALTQLTDTTNCQVGASAPGISADGTRIAFSSACTGTPAGIKAPRDLFIFDTVPGSVTQLTTATEGCRNQFPSISVDGTRIAFSYGCDQTTPIPTSGAEIYLAAPESFAPTPAVTAAVTPTATPSPTGVLVPTSTPTAVMTATPGAVVGDCKGDGCVTIEEILSIVNIALGSADLVACSAGDSSHDGEITIDEILAAVSNALGACSPV